MGAAAPARFHLRDAIVFAVLCLVVSFVWDVAYCLAYDRYAAGLTLLREMPPMISFFIAPAALSGALCVALRRRLGSSAIFAFAGCIGAPVLMWVPAIAFVCFAFNSCFGD